jgi:hypothetical protein
MNQASRLESVLYTSKVKKKRETVLSGTGRITRALICIVILFWIVCDDKGIILETSEIRKMFMIKSEVFGTWGKVAQASGKITKGMCNKKHQFSRRIDRNQGKS